MTLTELADYYYCDKYYLHSYIPFYEKLFAGMTVHKMLEIGIGYEEMMRPLVPRYIHGASLRMWEEYFPQAEIFSCDIRPETLINEGRIHSLVCDQYDHAALSALAGQFGCFDIIIDDGCHHPMAQIITFGALWPYLNDGGIYIIEDVGYPELISKAINGEAHIFRKNRRWDDVLVTKEKK